MDEEKINLIRIYPEATKTPDIVLTKLAAGVPLSILSNPEYQVIKLGDNIAHNPMIIEIKLNFNNHGVMGNVIP